MDTSLSERPGNHGSPLSFKTSDKIKRRVRDVVPSAVDAEGSVSDEIDSVWRQAKRGLETVKEAVNQTRESVADSTDAIITYTKENPVKALIISAGIGALVWSLFRGLVAPQNTER